MRQAIIDIGSNAIRAVVYDNYTLGAPEIYSDKFKSDLWSLLELDNIDVKHQTYLTLQHFTNIFKQLNVVRIDCVATAILRNHPKAVIFKDVVLEKYGIDIDIISGEREAFLTASGLMSGVVDADGIAVDLGGGSLEIVEIEGRKVGHLLSLPLGTKVIPHDMSGDEIVDTIKTSFAWNNAYHNLYLIGGAFRFMGRYYMEFVRYPLRNLHNLEVNTDDFLIFLEKIESIAKIKPIYQARRIDEKAILVAKALIKVLNPVRIVISNYGLKEGVRFLSLPLEEQDKNIIFERCKSLTGFKERDAQLDKYNKLIVNLLVSPDVLTIKTVDLAVILTNCSQNIDRTLKANFIAEFILSSDVPFTHRQRLMLGLAISHAFSSKSDLYINKLARKMLSRIDYSNSKIIGNVIRITREVDGPEFTQPSFNLQLRDNKYIEITTKEILPRPVFDIICDRLKDIAHMRKNT